MPISETHSLCQAQWLPRRAAGDPGPEGADRRGRGSGGRAAAGRSPRSRGQHLAGLPSPTPPPHFPSQAPPSPLPSVHSGPCLSFCEWAARHRSYLEGREFPACHRKGRYQPGPPRRPPLASEAEASQRRLWTQFVYTPFLY